MDKVNYLEIFKKAWTITWHHKYLWWLGLFAGSGMGLNIPSGMQKEAENNNWEEKIAPFIESHLTLIFGLIVFAILLFILLELLRVLAFNGLICSIFGIKKGEPKNLREAIREGKKFFVKVLGVRILFSFLTLALILLLVLPVSFLFLAHSYVLGSLTALMAFFILVPALVIFSFISQYGILYILTSGLSIRSALEQGYKLFVKNIGASLVMSLLFIPINIIAGITIFLPAMALVAFSVFFGFILYQLLSTLGFWIIGSIAGILILGLLLFIRSVLSVFYHSAWFLFFQEIATAKKEEMPVEKELIIESEIQPEKA